MSSRVIFRPVGATGTDVLFLPGNQQHGTRLAVARRLTSVTWSPRALLSASSFFVEGNVSWSAVTGSAYPPRKRTRLTKSLHFHTVHLLLWWPGREQGEGQRAWEEEWEQKMMATSYRTTIWKVSPEHGSNGYSVNCALLSDMTTGYVWEL